ncbi:unnamed protein product [Urochloa humidicola]
MKTCEILGNIASPFVKHLNITGGHFELCSLRARIYLPSLISLVLCDLGYRTPLLQDMPLLVSATIKVTGSCYGDCSNNIYGDCGDHSCPGCYSSAEGADDACGESMLLKGLSEVKDLELSVHSNVFIVNRDLKFGPTFYKLKTLFLSDWCPNDAADLNLLTYFLQHSPILEKLMLQLSKVPEGVKTKSSSKGLKLSFTCSHLKIVDIKCGEFDGRLQEILDILSAYAIPLELVNIQQTNGASQP